MDGASRCGLLVHGFRSSISDSLRAFTLPRREDTLAGNDRNHVFVMVRVFPRNERRQIVSWWVAPTLRFSLFFLGFVRSRSVRTVGWCHNLRRSSHDETFDEFFPWSAPHRSVRRHSPVEASLNSYKVAKAAPQLRVRERRFTTDYWSIAFSSVLSAKFTMLSS